MSGNTNYSRAKVSGLPPFGPSIRRVSSFAVKLISYDRVSAGSARSRCHRRACKSRVARKPLLFVMTSFLPSIVNLPRMLENEMASTAEASSVFGKLGRPLGLRSAEPSFDGYGNDAGGRTRLLSRSPRAEDSVACLSLTAGVLDRQLRAETKHRARHRVRLRRRPSSPSSSSWRCTRSARTRPRERPSRSSSASRGCSSRPSSRRNKAPAN